MTEKTTYPWTMKQFMGETVVSIKEAEQALDVVRAQVRSLEQASLGNSIRSEAFEGAAKQMAERAVHAETKAEIQALELAEVKRHRDRLIDDLKTREDSYRGLWTEFWIRQGFTQGRVCEALMSTFQIKRAQAEKEIESLEHCCYSFDVNHNGNDDRTGRERWIKAAAAFREKT